MWFVELSYCTSKKQAGWERTAWQAHLPEEMFDGAVADIAAAAVEEEEEEVPAFSVFLVPD